MTNFNFPKEFITNLFDSGYNVIGAKITTPINNSFIVFSNGKDLRIVKNNKLISNMAKEIAKNMPYPNAKKSIDYAKNSEKLKKIKVMINSKDNSLDIGM
jgi:hypothetical protein